MQDVRLEVYMRVKKDQLIITFSTTSDAMQMEAFCQREQIAGRLIPLPTEISAGCGLAWKTDPNQEDEITGKLDQQGIRWETMRVMKI